MMRIHYLQHVPFEGLGHIESWAKASGHGLFLTRLYNQEALPALESFDWLIIMGGPMNVYEEDLYPWLAVEKRLISQAIGARKIVLGICLGAQLIADVLGARVYRNQHKEIGWYPLSLTEQGRHSPLFHALPQRFTAFHWHGDTFDMPDGATWLAQSSGCRNQAFSYAGHVLALQFHLESTSESIRDIIANCGDEIIPGPYVQSTKDMIAAQEEMVNTHAVMEKILEGLVASPLEKS
jgi:GMP synthase-like glutamine amidotransferase